MLEEGIDPVGDLDVLVEGHAGPIWNRLPDDWGRSRGDWRTFVYSGLGEREEGKKRQGNEMSQEGQGCDVELLKGGGWNHTGAASIARSVVTQGKGFDAGRSKSVQRGRVRLKRKRKEKKRKKEEPRRTMT